MASSSSVGTSVESSEKTDEDAPTDGIYTFIDDGLKYTVALDKTDTAWNLYCNNSSVDIPEKVKTCPKLEINEEANLLIASYGDENEMFSLTFKDSYLQLVDLLDPDLNEEDASSERFPSPSNRDLSTGKEGIAIGPSALNEEQKTSRHPTRTQEEKATGTSAVTGLPQGNFIDPQNNKIEGGETDVLNEHVEREQVTIFADSSQGKETQVQPNTVKVATYLTETDSTQGNDVKAENQKPVPQSRERDKKTMKHKTEALDDTKMPSKDGERDEKRARIPASSTEQPLVAGVGMYQQAEKDSKTNQTTNVKDGKHEYDMEGKNGSDAKFVESHSNVTPIVPGHSFETNDDVEVKPSVVSPRPKEVLPVESGLTFDKVPSTTIDERESLKTKMPVQNNYPQMEDNIVETPLVFSKVFESVKLKERFKTKYDGKLTISIDTMESINKCKVTFNGTKAEFKSARDWINKKYVTPYTLNSIRFSDIKKYTKDLNLEMVVEDALPEASMSHVFWSVSDSGEQIDVCTDDTSRCDTAVAALKKCLKGDTILLQHHSSLLEMPEVKERKVVVEKLSDSLKVIGSAKAIKHIKSRLSNKVCEVGDSRRSEAHLDVNNHEEDNAAIEKSFELKQHKECNSEELAIRKSYQVKEMSDFEKIRDSSKLKEFASKNNVKIQESDLGLGFLLIGTHTNILKVEDKLNKMLQENIWKLRGGHCITVQASMNTSEDTVDTVVNVKTVELYAVGFHEDKELHLPESMDSNPKDSKEKVTKAVDSMLEFCSDSDYCTVKLEVQSLPEKVVKTFTFGIFEALYEEHIETKLQFQILICTNDDQMLRSLSDACQKSSEYWSQRSKNEAAIQRSQPSEEKLMKSYLVVSVMKEQLGSTKADVIVNTTGRDLNLREGKVSPAILKYAGEKLQEDIRKQCPKGLHFGEVITTAGYDIQGCKYILHGAIDEYKKTNSVKGLRKFVQTCLVKADELECKVIAFPAVGTGRLGYPKSAVAKAMFGAVRDFQNRLHFLRQVQFVIYHEDTETFNVFNEEEKIYVKQSNFYNRESTQTIGDIEVTINQGRISDIATEGFIYIWEKNSTYAVKKKEHELLKHVNPNGQKLWIRHRDDPQKRGTPLEAPGEDLAVSSIIHVFCDDTIQAVQSAILAGLRKADDMVSVTVFLSETSPFIRYGEQLVKVLIDSIMELKTNKSRLLIVHMMIESKSNNLVEQLKSHLEKGLKIQKTKGCIEDYPKGHSPTPLRPDLTEPQPQSISRTEEPNLDQQQKQWRDVHLDQEEKKTEFGCYIWIENVPETYKHNDLKDLITKKFPKLGFELVFIPGRTEALMICHTKKDANIIRKTDRKRIGVCFNLLSAQSLSRFEVEVEDVKDTELLKTMGIIVTGNKKGSVSICAPTKYQLDYANHVLRRGNMADDGFEYMVGECSQDVWDIVEALKSNEIKQLQQQGLVISYTFGHVDVINVCSWTDKETIEKIKSYIGYLKDMVILEIPINETNNEMVKKWCDEVGNEKCVFLEKRRLVLAFDKTYDVADRIKHQILVKDGQKRITKRGKRDFSGADKEIDHVINANEASSALNTYEISAKGYTRNKENPAGNQRRKEEKYFHFDLKQQANNPKKYPTPEHMAVYVYEADILKLPVDCIVNAANDTLQHGGGVARVIAQAAGRSLDKEGIAHIKKNGKVPVGKVCVTTAGNLHYNCVIHAVGPRWSDYSPHSLIDVQRCESHLYSALMESFSAAENRGLESIALPAISAAIFGVPEELCVYQYVKATLDYSRKQSPRALKEIHFIDINPSIIASIRNMFAAMLEPGHMPDYRTEKFVKTRQQQPAVSKTFEKGYNTNKAMGDKPKPVHYMENGNHIFQSEKCTLFIQCGDLWKTQADAIVSTEDTEGSGKGKIAKLIYEGVPSWKQKEYLRAKNSTFSGYVSPGKVYVTSGYDCGYKKVLHAVVPYEIRFESQEKRQDTIKQAVQNVFQEANKNSIYSVVMGLLGAGKNTRIDVQIAADAFIKAYQDYIQKSDRRLRITLVCRDDRVFEIIKEKLIEYELMEVVKETPPPVPRRLHHPEDVQEKEESENLKSLGDCVICMDQIAADRKVLECGHAFHEECIDQQFTFQKKCPTCGKVCGELTGDQPDGERKDRTDSWNNCAGFENYGRISITYTFPAGKQGPNHPNPGKPYKGITRTAYLPDTAEGREILEMLKVAFDRKLTFTIGSSRTTGEEGVITWNDIHHKTDPKPNTQFGYPDPTYLDRVKDELAVKGITVKDIAKKH